MCVEMLGPEEDLPSRSAAQRAAPTVVVTDISLALQNPLTDEEDGDDWDQVEDHGDETETGLSDE
jgi:hypothetical protein